MLESGSRVLNPSSGNDLGEFTQSSRFLMFSSVLSGDGGGGGEGDAGAGLWN